MEKRVEVTASEKRRMKVICFIPAVAFFLTLVYYLFLQMQLLQGHHPPESGSNITVHHYGTLFVMLAASATISAAVLLFCIVHLARRLDINTATKMTWILVLIVCVPISFILFWYFKIRPEPRIQQIKDIK